MIMRQTFCITFLCRESKANRQGLSPIEISIVINGKRTYIATQRKERPDDFKKSMSQKKDNKIKSFCENMRIKINDIAEEMMMKNIALTAPHLKDYMANGAVEKEYTLNDLFNDYMAVLDDRLKINDITPLTYRRYKWASEKFMEANSLAGDEKASSITLDNIIRLKNSLLIDYHKNTAFSYLTKIKLFFRYAWECGKIPSFPFSTFTPEKDKEGKMEYLTADEVAKIANKIISIDRMDRVRDLFLFQCYTGLSYADLTELKPEDIKKSSKGMLYINKRREKTNIEYFTVLLGNAPAILNKYDGDIQKIMISNQKYNLYLKSLGDICNIGKNLTTKMARTTAAVYLLNNNVPIETVSRILGHSNTTTTRAFYAKIMPDKVLKDIQEMNKEIEKPDIEKLMEEFTL